MKQGKLALAIMVVAAALLAVVLPRCGHALHFEIKNLSGGTTIVADVGVEFQYTVWLVFDPGDEAVEIRHVMALHTTPSQCFTVADGCNPRTPLWDHLGGDIGEWQPSHGFWGAGVILDGPFDDCEYVCGPNVRGFARFQIGDWAPGGYGSGNWLTRTALLGYHRAVVYEAGTYPLGWDNDIGMAHTNEYQIADGTIWWYGTWYGPISGIGAILVVGGGATNTPEQPAPTWSEVKGLYR